MRVFGLTTGADTAGVNVATKRAFARHAPEWHFDTMVASQNYIRYPVDVPWSQRRLEELYDAADVVAIHNTTHAHDWYDAGQRKPMVLMHHGRTGVDFRKWQHAAAHIGALQVGSTLDLELVAGIPWAPPPIDIEAMRDIRRKHYRPGRRIRVGHAPTNKAIKGTDMFTRAMAGIDAEMVLIEHVSWAECLERKATCDVFFDQPHLGYGLNAVEAWAMGIPVIAGVDEPEIRAGMVARWGILPWAEGNPGELHRKGTDFAGVLRALVADEGLRAEYARRGTAHVERWHDERYVVELLKQVYAEAPPTRRGGSLRRKVNRRERIRAARLAAKAAAA